MLKPVSYYEFIFKDELNKYLECNFVVLYSQEIIFKKKVLEFNLYSLVTVVDSLSIVWYFKNWIWTSS